MQCPKCAGKLLPTTFGSVEVDQCTVCQGVWLDVGELPVLLKQKNTHYSPTPTDAAIHNAVTVPCPRCGGEGHMTRMEHVNSPDVIIDSCPVCYGIWLDGGELDRLTDQGFSTTLKRIVQELRSLS